MGSMTVIRVGLVILLIHKLLCRALIRMVLLTTVIAGVTISDIPKTNQVLWLCWLGKVLTYFIVVSLVGNVCALVAIHVLPGYASLPWAIWSKSFQFIRVASHRIRIVPICNDRSFHFGLVDQIAFITIEHTPSGRVVFIILLLLKVIWLLIFVPMNWLIFVWIFGRGWLIDGSLWLWIVGLVVKGNWLSQHLYSLKQLRWTWLEWTILFYIIYRFIPFITTLFSILMKQKMMAFLFLFW